MKTLLLATFLLFSNLIHGQIFNRSKAGALDAIPFQLGNTLYTLNSSSIDEIDANGDIMLRTALPFLSDYRASKTVLRKANGNVLIIGSYQAACDILSDLGYFAYEYSPQMILVDSTHQALNDISGIMQVLELSQNRYFALSENGYLLLNSSLDTLATALTPNLAELNRAIYLGGDEVLIYSQTWASSTPLYNVLNLATGTITPWSNARAGQITSLSDSTFAFVNLQNGDVLRFRKNNRAYIDSTRLTLSTNFVANQFQEFSDGFVLRGDSGLTVFNKADLSLRGSYLADQPLNRGALSVDGNQLFFYQQNVLNVSNYHVLEAAKVDQPASAIVEGLILKIENSSLVANPHPSGAANLFQVSATWELTLVNNSQETIDSVRVLWSDPTASPFCTSPSAELPTGINGLAVGDSVVVSYPMVFSSVYAPNGTAFLNFNAAIVMANGKVVDEEGYSSASEVINNISLAELGPLTELNLFPNPASTFIYIDAPKAVKQVQILNLQGQRIREVSAPNGLKQFSLAGLAKGIYWVKLQSENRETLRKVVVD
tara:strand:- start:9362 stop:10996 length:1635 start_codon:yes stop_codon:yes gene_type:complete